MSTLLFSKRTRGLGRVGIQNHTWKTLNRSPRLRRRAYALELLETRTLLSGLSWTTGTPLPVALGGTASLDTGLGVLVVGGGTTATGATTPATAYLQDPTTGVWTAAPALDQGRFAGAIGRTGALGPFGPGGYKYSGDIFVYGGAELGQVTASALNYYVYPASYGGESVTAPALATARSSFAAATDPASGALYAIGGLNSTNQALASVERYDPTLDAWANVAPLPQALARASAASDGAGHILVFGGAGASGALSSTVYSYTIASNTWSTMAAMPVAASGAAALFGAYGQIYLVGGKTTTGPTSAVWVFNPVTNQWAPDTSLPTPEYGASVTLDANNNLEVIGGFNAAGNAVGTVYSAPALPAPTGLPVVPNVQFNILSYLYNAQPQGAAVSVVGTDGITPVSGNLTLTYNGSATLPQAVGTYHVLATFTSTDPGYVNTQAQAQLQIFPATPTLTLTGGGTITYDGQPHGVTASALGVDHTTPVNGSYAYTYNGLTTVPVNPGTYTAVANFSSADPNYTNATASTTITIPDPTIPTGVTAAGASTTSIRISWNPVPGAASYDVWQRFVIHDPKGSGSTITYHVVAGTTGTSVVLNLTSGTFYVSSVSSTGVVSPRSAAVSAAALYAPSLYNFLWGGAVMSSASVEVGQTLNVTLLGYGNETPTYTLVSGPTTMSVNPTTGVVTYSPLASEAGFVSATFKATNSVGSSTATFQFHVLAQPLIVVTGGTFTFDGNTHAASAIAYATDGITPLAGTFTFQYAPAAYPNSWSTAPYAEPGNYLVKAIFTSSDPNYGNGTGTSTLTIVDPWAGTPNVTVTTGNTTTWTSGSRINSITVQTGAQLTLQAPDTIETRTLALDPGSVLNVNAHFV
ncbi:MAG: kelch repeat-containing protein, partial [Phycisphaerae bacterium]